MICPICPYAHFLLMKFFLNRKKNLDNYLQISSKMLQLTLYEQEYTNLNFFAKLFEWKDLKHKFEWLSLT